MSYRMPKGYWQKRANLCTEFADEGECLAQLTQQGVPVTIGGLGLTPSQRYRRYWDRRAKLCTEFADEGECLAQVARHVPVTIGGLGMQGLGTENIARDVQTAVSITAGLFSNPDATLRQYGPPIVAAAEQHVVNPIIDRIGASMAPYVVRYLVPPLVLLYIISGVGAFYSYQTARQMRVTKNRRRRRRGN